MPEITPSTSSPSLYSRPPSHVGHSQTRRLRVLSDSDLDDNIGEEDEDDDEDDEDEDDLHSRLSMISGPTLRKYSTEVPWDEGLSVRSSTFESSHKPSSSSLASTTSIVDPTTPKLSLADEKDFSMVRGPKALGLGLGLTLGPSAPILGDMSAFQSADRPLLSSGSPGFGLISLEVARERERERANRKSRQPPLPSHAHAHSHSHPSADPQQQTPHAHGHETKSAPSSPTGKVLRGKKSGLMKLFNKTTTPGRAGIGSNLKIGEPIPCLPPPSSKASSASVSSRNASVSSMDNHHWLSRASHHSRKAHHHPNPTPGPSAPTAAAAPPPGPEPSHPPNLELRPVSMTFTNALPEGYLSSGSIPYEPVAPAPAQKPTSITNDLESSSLREQVLNARKAWRVQLFELEAQIRELKDELDAAKQTAKAGLARCGACGCDCGGRGRGGAEDHKVGVMDRKRAKTGGARGVFGSGSLYEWD
ncbi:hypothetical protein P7C73_g1893, partial [Tremellales sp. Uapishka_1]